MRSVQTRKAPAAIGPYSQATVTQSLIFTSGQIPIDPQSGATVGSDITAQTTQVLDNLKAVLEAAGSKLENALKITCFLASMEDFAAFNEV